MASRWTEVLDEWKDDGISYEEHDRGVILAYEKRAGFDDRRRYDDAFAEHGYVPEVLDASALHAKERAFRSAFDTGSSTRVIVRSHLGP